MFKTKTTDFSRALSVPLSEEKPLISDAILDMFSSDADNSLEKMDRTYERFNIARNLYQTILLNPKFNLAFFYRFSDTQKNIEEYREDFMAIRDELKTYVKQQDPTMENITDFFNSLKGKSNTYDNIAKWLLTFELQGLCSDDSTVIDAWFGAEDRFNGILEIAEEGFYNLEINLQDARDSGILYEPPGGPENHNWGTNAAWTLAIARKLAEIRVLSALDEDGVKRSDRPDHPSAFALEISMAISMGYRFNFDENIMTLTPPSTFNYSQTTGTPGSGVIPTLEQQMVIFQQCVLSRQLYEKFQLNDIPALNAMVSEIYTPGTDEKNIAFVI